MQLTILTHHGDGTATCLATGAIDTAALGSVTRRRASHILPSAPWKRRAFCWLRRRFGDRGRIADWTRTWRGPWEVWLAKDEGGRQKAEPDFTHQDRAACLAWEIEHFTRNPP
jgi:hypothetical protein